MHPPRAKPLSHRQHRWRTALMRLLLPTASLPWILLTGAWLVLPGAGVAQLAWDQEKIEQQATAFEAERAFSYAFTNKGDYPITVTSLTSSCGCTTAALSQESYAPGESGVIEATFDIGDRRGSQSKTLTVRTDDPRNPVTTLVVNLEIAEVIELQPRLLLWRKGEARTPKTVRVVVHQPDLLQLEGIGPKINPSTNEPTDHPFRLTWQPPPPEVPETPESSEVAIGKSFTNDSEAAPEGGETLPSNEENVSPKDDSAVVYKVLVEPPAQGRTHKAAYALIPQHPLPEGVTLPTLVVRTLGEPPTPPHE